MGGFNYDKIKKILTNNYKIAVETGTCTGEGTKKLSSHFDKIYTVEINDKLFKEAKKKFKSNENIICLHGDSKKIILELSEELNKSNS